MNNINFQHLCSTAKGTRIKGALFFYFRNLLTILRYGYFISLFKTFCEQRWKWTCVPLSGKL